MHCLLSEHEKMTEIEGKSYICVLSILRKHWIEFHER